MAATEVHTVFANVELANPASARVLEKAGFCLVGQCRGTEEEHLACYRTVADQQ